MTDFVYIQFNDQNIDVDGLAEVVPFCLISACPIFSAEAREGSVRFMKVKSTAIANRR